MHRIDPNKPIGTITGDYFIHPYEDRMLGVNELKRLNGFPLDHKFEQHPRYTPSFIARGVSPTVAEYLGAQIANSIRHNAEIEVNIETVDIRTPPVDEADLPVKKKKKKAPEQPAFI